ncbi:hypothetical protein D3C80_2109770 [compost metagenome]
MGLAYVYETTRIQGVAQYAECWLDASIALVLWVVCVVFMVVGFVGSCTLDDEG